MAEIKDEAVPVASGPLSTNLKMGNPSGAVADPSMPDNYLLDRTEFATSYNNSKGTPNWVSWRLVASDIGKAPRENFYADPDLPDGFLRVDPTEYTDSGFDRGHMCPHEDRTTTVATSTATFTMTNVIPQSHDLNTMAWETLEDYCRSLTQTEGTTCYILDGPAGQGGTGKNGLAQTTPDGKVVVPSRNWKVVMVLDTDVDAASDLTTDSAIRLIALIAPNADGQEGEDWTPFRTTVNAVETLTGFTFFSAVDPAIINPLKGQVDTTPVTSTPSLVRGVNRPSGSQTQTAPTENAAMTALGDFRQATQGMLYPSESDEPMEPFSWGMVDGTLTDETLRDLAGQDPRARVEKVSVDQFFDRLTKPKQAQSQVKPEMAERFSTLLARLKDHLSHLEVVKFGRSEVTIFIVGRLKNGEVAGVKTAATET